MAIAKDSFQDLVSLHLDSLMGVSSRLHCNETSRQSQSMKGYNGGPAAFVSKSISSVPQQMAMLPDRQLLLFLIASIKPGCSKYLEPHTKSCLSQHCFLALVNALFLACWFLFGNQVHSDLLNFPKTLSDQSQETFRFCLKLKAGKSKVSPVPLSVQGEKMKI